MEPSTRVCPNCGAEAGDNDYCPRCGTHLVALPELPTRLEWESGQPSAASATPKASPMSAPPSPLTPSTPPAPTLAGATPAPEAPALAAPPVAVARPPVPAAVWAGTLLAVSGAVCLVLPLVSSYIHVGQNSLVEGASTKSRIIPFLAGALVIVSGLVTAHTQRRRGPVLTVALGGAVGLIAAIINGTDHGLRIVTTINVLGEESGTLKAGLGPAMYVAGVGGVLAIVGALIWAANAAEW